MTTTASFGASDAQVHVVDDSTRLAKARAAVAYYDRELAAAQDAYNRVLEKLTRFDALREEVTNEVDDARNYVTDLQAFKSEAQEKVRSLAPGEDE